MTVEERIALLGTIPLFGSFSPQDVRAIAAMFTEHSFGKGETVTREGEAASDFMVLVSGELEVSSGTPPRVVGRLGPGEVLGEMAALLGEGRTATVIASRRSTVLALSEREFQRIVASDAKALATVSRILAQRLASRMRDDKADVGTRLISIVGEPDLKGKSLVAGALASLLAESVGGEAVLVRLDPREGSSLPDLVAAPPERIVGAAQPGGGGPASLVVAPPAGSDRSSVIDGLATVTMALASRFPLVVVDPGRGRWVRAEDLAEISDVLVEVVRTPDEPSAAHPTHTKVFRVLNQFNDGTPLVPINAVAPFVLPVDVDLIALETNEAIKEVMAQPRSPVSRPLRRLARSILGCTVGVAFGGGAAFGIAHVGVLKALEEAGIPVDIVVGTSFGSIVALGYGMGMDPDEMVEIARRIGNRRTVLSALDVAFMKPGLLSGNRLEAIFGPFVGSTTRFDQLTVPAQFVAADIETGERVCIGDGSLMDAVRVSCSVPMLVVPVKRDGRTLVDGGIVDPVPADVVSELGADICIGINVVPRLSMEEPNVLSRMFDRLNALNPIARLNGTAGMPNIFEVIMNTIQLLQYELATFKAITSDVTINVDAGDLTWHEFHRALELIDRGYQAGQRAVPEIRRVFDERRGATGIAQ